MARPAAKGGRPAKGGIRLPVRFPEEHLAHYKAAATAVGLSVTDYLAMRLAGLHDLPAPPWMEDPHQPRLDLVDQAA